MVKPWHNIVSYDWDYVIKEGKVKIIHIGRQSASKSSLDSLFTSVGKTLVTR